MVPYTAPTTYRRLTEYSLHNLIRSSALAVLIFSVTAPSGSAEISMPSSSPTSSGSSLDDARSAKRKAQAYQDAGDFTNATASWMQTAKAYDRAGFFGEAALAWTEAATLNEKQGKTSDQTIALIHLGYSLKQIGQHKKAVTTLQVARILAEKASQPVLQATALGQLATTVAALGNETQAINLFTDALALARNNEQSALVAILLNDLGNALASQGRTSEAISAYMESTILAKGTSQTVLSMNALTNAALASLDDGQVANAKDRLELAYRQASVLPDSHEKAFGLINLALAYDELRPQISPEHVMLAQLDPAALPGSRGIGLKQGQRPAAIPSRADLAVASIAKETPTASDQQLFRNRSEELLRAAMRIASQIGDHGTESFALGYLGQLSERDKRYADALQLTRKAVFAAQKANAPESLYRWHWQTGRLLRATGNQQEAIQAYRRAISTLQPIRHEFSIGYRGRRHSFRDSIGPVFFELADLLLNEASTKEDLAQQQQLLVQARDTSELFKAAELQDYFKDECVKSARSRSTLAGVLPAGTAVIYPIILPDRLELLMNITGKWSRISTSVSVDTFTDEIRAFRRSLQDRSSREYLSHGRQLHRWIIKPLEANLAAAHITTLVFVPDGALRTIPMAALHDGHEFLMNRFALATTPGIDLIDFRPIDRSAMRMLSLGLTEAVQGFPALPNVKPELDAVKSMYVGKSLLNEQFRVRSFETEMRDNQYSVVHIASHGLVGTEASDSFLLAYDDKISMDRLSQLIGMYQFRKSSLELLTLSACETAVGDDRAALGLAGVAVKAGARSALASLWFIDDEATSHLVTEFYRQLQDPSVSKATALQRAQQKVSNDPAHDHPSYWAPFLLINNWL